MTPIVIVGEARGAEEDKINSSFVGASGIELLHQLDDAHVLTLTGEDRSLLRSYYGSRKPEYIDEIWRAHSDIVYRTNVINFHPPGNKFDLLCGSKAEGLVGWPAFSKARYLLKRYEAELDRLAGEILARNPNLIIGLGNIALWALAGKSGITKLRGTTLLSTHTVADFKFLPTYHPAFVLRQYDLRATAIMDLIKAGREAKFPELRRPSCEIWIEPDLADIDTFFKAHVKKSILCSIDIETSGERITCIGFAPTPTLAIVIPFDDGRQQSGSYWPSNQHERQCWELVRSVLEDGSIPKVFQNGLYDIGFLMRSYGILVRGAREDTMLLHHARQPESLKGLGYLGSIYTDHGSWKTMRTETKTIKRDS